MLSTIALNPYFAVGNIYVNKATVNAFGILPTYRHHQVAVGFTVKDALILNLAIIDSCDTSQL